MKRRIMPTVTDVDRPRLKSDCLSIRTSETESTSSFFDRPPSGREWVSWLWCVIGAIAIYLTIPFARAVSGFVTREWGRQTFLYAMLVVIALGLVLAFYLLWRHRQRTRRANVLWISFTGMLYFYFILDLKAAPEEALHFVEYGALGILIFRALSHRIRDPGIYLAAVLIGAVAGTLDEMIQWVTPQRVFDYRDVGFNALSGVLIQLAIWKGFEPRYIVPPVRLVTIRRICGIAAVQVVILGACLLNTPQRTGRLIRLVPAIEHVRSKSSAMTEYGYRHVIPGMGIFYSRFTLDELRRIDRERAPEAAAVLDIYYAPQKYGEFLAAYTPSIDPFLHELRVHLFRRDHHYWTSRKHHADPRMFAWHNTVAYRENEFADAFFPHTVARSRYRYPETRIGEMRTHMDKEILYESAVSRNLITRVNERQVRWIIMGVLTGLASVALWARYADKKGSRLRRDGGLEG